MSAHDITLFGDQVAAARLAAKFAAVDAQKLLRLAIEDLFPGRIALVSSFGADSAVLLHMVAEIDKALPIVFVDTLQLFPETLAYRDALVAHLGLTQVVTKTPDETSLAEADPENFLWAEDPDRCCGIRKVAPLAKALDGYEAWITGRKRFQGTTRAALPLFEAEGERVKVNPLAGWTQSRLDAYFESAWLAAARARSRRTIYRSAAFHAPRRSSPAKRRAPDAGAVVARPNAAFTARRSTQDRTSDMALFKDGSFVPDPWHRLDAAEELPTSGQILMSLDDWHRRAPLRSHSDAALSNVAFGLILEPDDPLEEIVPDLPHLALIAVAFPKFTDGRAYSMARLIRGRFGFTGELRAVGDVLFDQLQLMARCGFNAFEISDAATLRLLASGRRPDVHQFYQPGAGPEAPAGTRPWARRPLD